MALVWNGDQVARTIKARSAAASQKIAEMILERAKAECPVVTGELRDSGHIRAGGDATDADDSEAYRTVVFDAKHAVHVATGTARQVANPFLQRAILFVRADASRIMKTIWGWK